MRNQPEAATQIVRMLFEAFKIADGYLCGWERTHLLFFFTIGFSIESIPLMVSDRAIRFSYLDVLETVTLIMWKSGIREQC